MTTEARVRMIVDTDSTVVSSTPMYTLRMALEAKVLGIDPTVGSVQRVILSGEPADSIPATKVLIEEQWVAKAANTAGMIEVGTIVMFECERQPGGACLIEDHHLEEVIDPIAASRAATATRESASSPPSVVGTSRCCATARVTLCAGCRAPHCTCGRGLDIHDGGVRSRVDDMKVVRGTTVYPS